MLVVEFGMKGLSLLWASGFGIHTCELGCCKTLFKMLKETICVVAMIDLVKIVYI
jgi:hypothetical protein